MERAFGREFCWITLGFFFVSTFKNLVCAMMLIHIASLCHNFSNTPKSCFQRTDFSFQVFWCVEKYIGHVPAYFGCTETPLKGSTLYTPDLAFAHLPF